MLIDLETMAEMPERWEENGAMLRRLSRFQGLMTRRLDVMDSDGEGP